MTAPKDVSSLGEALVAEGVLSAEQLEHSLAEQKKTGRMLGEILAEQGIIDSTTVLRVLSKSLDVPHCYLRPGLTDPSVFDLLGEDEAKRLKAVPMFKVGDTLTVAMAEPQSLPKARSIHNGGFQKIGRYGLQASQDLVGGKGPRMAPPPQGCAAGIKAPCYKSIM